MLPIENAIDIACLAHSGQKDKAGQPYIYHPIRVMMACRDETTRIVAILHDVPEDTNIGLGHLAKYVFPDRPDIMAALTALTRVDGETYVGYIQRVGDNPIATTVKLADLHDNMDVTRIPNPTAVDFRRWDKYYRAQQYLLIHNADLRGRSCPLYQIEGGSDE